MGIWRKAKTSDTLSISGGIMNSYTNAGLSAAECLNDTSKQAKIDYAAAMKARLNSTVEEDAGD